MRVISFNLQFFNNHFRVDTFCIVSRHITERNRSIRLDDERGRFRQLPIFVPVMCIDIWSRCFININQVIWHVKDEVELTCDNIINITQYIKIKFILFFRRKGIIRRFRTDRDKSRAFFLNRCQLALVSAELEVTVWAPSTSVICDDDWSILKERFQIDGCPVRVRQFKRRRLISNC